MRKGGGSGGGGGGECIWDIGRKARRKETNRKNEMEVGRWIILKWILDRMGW
jgi:hypothetical protein